MTIDDDNVDLTALADGLLGGSEWEVWLIAHPDAAAEVAMMRRVRALVMQLRSFEVVVPEDFEARVLARVRTNTTLLDLLELSFSSVGRAFLDVLDLAFGLLPTSRAPSA
jgi:anti-sigma factor RsiW